MTKDFVEDVSNKLNNRWVSCRMGDGLFISRDLMESKEIGSHPTTFR